MIEERQKMKVTGDRAFIKTPGRSATRNTDDLTKR